MKYYKVLQLDCEIIAQKEAAELIKTRRVGSLDGELVYFIPAPNKSFYLVIESSPRHFRKLTDEEHRTFREQSRVQNAGWKEQTA